MQDYYLSINSNEGQYCYMTYKISADDVGKVASAIKSAGATGHTAVVRGLGEDADKAYLMVHKADIHLFPTINAQAYSMGATIYDRPDWDKKMEKFEIPKSQAALAVDLARQMRETYGQNSISIAETKSGKCMIYCDTMLKDQFAEKCFERGLQPNAYAPSILRHFWEKATGKEIDPPAKDLLTQESLGKNANKRNYTQHNNDER